MKRGPIRDALGTIRGGVRELLSVRWVRRVAVLLVLLLVARAATEPILAFGARRLAARRGLLCEWRDLDLSFTTGRGTVHDLVLRALPPEDGSDPGPLLEVEYGVFDLDVLKLLTGELSISRAEVDGLHSWWIRDAEGVWNVEQFISPEETLALLRKPPADAPPAAGGRPVRGPLDLSPGIAIGALRFQHAACHIVDRAVDPPLDLTLRVDAALSDLDDPERPAHFSASVLGGDLVNAAHVEGEVTWGADEIAVALRARAGNIHPKLLSPYLVPLDVHPLADSIEARLLAFVRVSVVGEARDTLSADLELSEIFLRADGAEALALDRLRVDLHSWSPRGTILPGIEVEGIRGRASLEPDAALRVAGLEITGAGWLDAYQELDAALAPGGGREKQGPPGWLALVFREDPDALAWSMGSLDVRDGLLDITDRTLESEASFPLHIDTISLGEVQHVPGGDKSTIPVEARFRAPGIAESIAITGSLGPFAPSRSIELDLQVDGIGLDSLEPRMRTVGVEGAIRNGSFHARLVGAAETDGEDRTRGRLALERIVLEDGGDLFGVQSIRAEGLLFDPAENLVRFGDVEIAGTRLAVTRDPSRRFFALGLRTLGISPGPSSAPAVQAEDSSSRPAAGAPPAATPPRFEFGRVAWVDNDLEFVDQAADPPRRFTFDELTVELEDLTLGGAAGGPVPEPARFTARVVAPGVVDELSASGTIRSAPGPIDLSVELALAGRGGTGELIGPYLRALGVEPGFTDANLSADLAASVKRDGESWSVGLALLEASLLDGESPLLSVEELRLEGVRLGAGIEVASMALVAPRVSARRDADGGIVLAGLRLLRRDGEDDGGAAAPAGDGESASPALPALPALVVREVSVEDARLAWSDASLSPPLETWLGLDASLANLRTDGTAGTFQARLQVPETLARLDLQGRLTLGEDELGVALTVDGAGLEPGPLARLLPAGVQLEAAAGRLHAELDATLGRAPRGGLQANVGARAFSWGVDGEEPWIALESARLRAPRIDPAGGVLTLGPISAQGLTIDASRDADGVVHLLGLAVAEAERAPPAAEPGTAPADEESEPAGASIPRTLPRIELVEDVRLNLARFGWRDASLGADALPLEAGATFRVETPVVLVDARPQELDPIRLRLEGSLVGMVERWGLGAELTPFAEQPRFEASFEAAGVRTAGLIERVPSLAPLLAGEVDSGTLAAAMRAELSVRRARPTDLGLTRPFSAEIELHGLEYRDRPDGEVLAGLERILVDVRRVDPRSGLVHVKALEIHEPRGRIRRTAGSVHALGFALDLDAERADEQPPVPDQPALDRAHDPRRAVAVEASFTPEQPAGSELRVDQLVVQGLDFVVVDETVDPPDLIVLTELDTEVRRFTTRALVEDRPIHFSSYLESGSSADAVFGELAVSGRVSLHPVLAGWTQLSMTGLELPRLASLAAVEGFEVHDGALDASLRLRFLGQQGARVDTTLVFTDLDMDEPEGGLIERALALPMSLDSALFLLRSPAGEHRFSVGISVDQDGLSAASIATAAATAFAEVLARALAAAPMRLLGSLVPGEAAEEREPRKTWSIGFVPGAAETGAELELQAERAVDERAGYASRALVLRHELSRADVAQAERLANPSQATCLELVRGLRQRKARLLRSLDEASTEAHALHAIGDARAPAAGELVRERARELASIEDSLDHVLDILRSDAPRHRDKRTRAAALRIAERRLQAVQESLQGQLMRAAWQRIEVRPARFEVAPGEAGGQVVIELRQR